MIPFFDTGAVEAALDYPRLIEALREAFAAGDIEAPVRTAHEVGAPEAPGGCWRCRLGAGGMSWASSW